MKNLSIAGFVFSLLLLANINLPSSANAQTAEENGDRKPVVVELFTSEGCSSCPPADVLLQKLEAQQPVRNALVIPLEEHVDYWNHDGWIDPYSSPEWTDRQQAYSSLQKKDPYTPELVVDGQSQLVGNNPKDAVLAIEDATRNEKADVTITPADVNAKSARFSVAVGKIAESKAGDVAEVWLAVTEDGLHSAVSSGENAGRQLNHIATLRSLHKIGVAEAKNGQTSFGGDTVVKFNSHWKVENLHVTVFVQQKRSREIVGAATTKVKS
jgi:hypothetical protein